MVDLFLVYQFIRKLVTPFNKWDAYKLGIIDEKGQVLIKRKDFGRKAQKDAFGIFDVMILNLKKMLAKIPGGDSKLGSYAAALFLIKEYKAFSPDEDCLLVESLSDESIELKVESFSRYANYIISSGNVKDFMHEDGNTVGGGNIAGLGIGDDGEPGFSKAQQAKHKKKNKKSGMLKNFKDVKYARKVD